MSKPIKPKSRRGWIKSLVKYIGGLECPLPIGLEGVGGEFGDTAEMLLISIKTRHAFFSFLVYVYRVDPGKDQTRYAIAFNSNDAVEEAARHIESLDNDYVRLNTPRDVVCQLNEFLKCQDLPQITNRSGIKISRRRHRTT